MKMRGIRPDFWVDEGVVEVSAFARLLFIGLWQMACDNGHVKDKPRKIKMSILPADPVHIDDLLDELVTVGLIERSAGWISVPNLSKHQRIDRRYFLTCEHDGCVKPDVPTEDDTTTSPAPDTAGPRGGHDEHPTGPRDEGEGEGEGETNTLTGVGRNKATTKRGTRLPADFIPSENSRHTILTEHPEVDVRREHAKFVDYWTAQSGQRGIRLDWDATWRNWMRKASEDINRRNPSRQQQTDDLFNRAANRMGVTDPIGATA